MPPTKASRRAPERGQRVAAARKRVGVTQHELAERSGISRSTIARIELGQLHPTVGVALALAGVLDTTVETLFGGGR